MLYTHLTEDDRYEIYEQRGRGKTLKAIALSLGRNKSTISRELRRNVGQRAYRPKQAHERAFKRLHTRRGGKVLSRETLARSIELLRETHSPQQVAGRVVNEGLASISHETLYCLIYADKACGGDIWRNLRCQKKRRKRYGSGRQRRGKIPNRIGIEKRCPRVKTRSTVGHWEGDTVIGKNHKFAIITLVERKTGYGIMRKVKTKHAGGVADAIAEALKPLKRLARTITFDNGLEFARHGDITEAIGAQIYFADPYASWQRGTNENWNGLLRQFFPKKSCFSSITPKQLKTAQDTLNNRARKRLDYCTPIEALLPSARRAGVALAL